MLRFARFHRGIKPLLQLLFGNRVDSRRVLTPCGEQRDRYRKTFFLALLAAAALASLGCATPKTINGRPVIGTRWVDGKVVYVLGETEADRQRLQEGAREAEAASKDVVFKPLK